jgi:hypothetical protein
MQARVDADCDSSEHVEALLPLQVSLAPYSVRLLVFAGVCALTIWMFWWWLPGVAGLVSWATVRARFIAVTDRRVLVYRKRPFSPDVDLLGAYARDEVSGTRRGRRFELRVPSGTLRGFASRGTAEQFAAVFNSNV